MCGVGVYVWGCGGFANDGENKKLWKERRKNYVLRRKIYV